MGNINSANGLTRDLKFDDNLTGDFLRKVFEEAEVQDERVLRNSNFGTESNIKINLKRACCLGAVNKGTPESSGTKKYIDIKLPFINTDLDSKCPLIYEIETSTTGNNKITTYTRDGEVKFRFTQNLNDPDEYKMEKYTGTGDSGSWALDFQKKLIDDTDSSNLKYEYRAFPVGTVTNFFTNPSSEIPSDVVIRYKHWKQTDSEGNVSHKYFSSDNYPIFETDIIKGLEQRDFKFDITSCLKTKSIKADFYTGSSSVEPKTFCDENSKINNRKTSSDASSSSSYAPSFSLTSSSDASGIGHSRIDEPSNNDCPNFMAYFCGKVMYDQGCIKIKETPLLDSNGEYYQYSHSKLGEKAIFNECKKGDNEYYYDCVHEKEVKHNDFSARLTHRKAFIDITNPNCVSSGERQDIPIQYSYGPRDCACINSPESPNLNMYYGKEFTDAIDGSKTSSINNFKNKIDFYNEAQNEMSKDSIQVKLEHNGNRTRLFRDLNENSLYSANIFNLSEERKPWESDPQCHAGISDNNNWNTYAFVPDRARETNKITVNCNTSMNLNRISVGNSANIAQNTMINMCGSGGKDEAVEAYKRLQLFLREFQQRTKPEDDIAKKLLDIESEKNNIIRTYLIRAGEFNINQNDNLDSKINELKKFYNKLQIAVYGDNGKGGILRDTTRIRNISITDPNGYLSLQRDQKLVNADYYCKAMNIAGKGLTPDETKNILGDNKKINLSFSYSFNTFCCVDNVINNDNYLERTACEQCNVTEFTQNQKACDNLADNRENLYKCGCGQGKKLEYKGIFDEKQSALNEIKNNVIELVNLQNWVKNEHDLALEIKKLNRINDYTTKIINKISSRKLESGLINKIKDVIGSSNIKNHNKISGVNSDDDLFINFYNNKDTIRKELFDSNSSIQELKEYRDDDETNQIKNLIFGEFANKKYLLFDNSKYEEEVTFCNELSNSINEIYQTLGDYDKIKTIEEKLVATNKNSYVSRLDKKEEVLKELEGKKNNLTEQELENEKNNIDADIEYIDNIQLEIKSDKKAYLGETGSGGYKNNEILKKIIDFTDPEITTRSFDNNSTKLINGFNELKTFFSNKLALLTLQKKVRSFENEYLKLENKINNITIPDKNDSFNLEDYTKKLNDLNTEFDSFISDIDKESDKIESDNKKYADNPASGFKKYNKFNTIIANYTQLKITGQTEKNLILNKLADVYQEEGGTIELTFNNYNNFRRKYETNIRDLSSKINNEPYTNLNTLINNGNNIKNEIGSKVSEIRGTKEIYDNLKSKRNLDGSSLLEIELDFEDLLDKFYFLSNNATNLINNYENRVETLKAQTQADVIGIENDFVNIQDELIINEFFTTIPVLKSVLNSNKIKTLEELKTECNKLLNFGKTSITRINLLKDNYARILNEYSDITYSYNIQNFDNKINEIKLLGTTELENLINSIETKIKQIEDLEEQRKIQQQIEKERQEKIKKAKEELERRRKQQEEAKKSAAEAEAAKKQQIMMMGGGAVLLLIIMMMVLMM